MPLFLCKIHRQGVWLDKNPHWFRSSIALCRGDDCMDDTGSREVIDDGWAFAAILFQRTTTASRAVQTTDV